MQALAAHPAPSISPETNGAPVEGPATLRAGQRLDWPLALPADPLWRAALEAEVGDSARGLAHAWGDLIHGQLQLWCESTGLERVYLLARASTGPRSERFALSPMEAEIAKRALCGEPQKVLAIELGIAPSTVSGRCRRALEKLAPGSDPVSLPLVLAAQASAGAVDVPEGRGAGFVYQGCPCLIMSVPRPVTAGLECLSHAERQVAQLFIEGRSRDEIARHRATCTTTVASQVHSIFATMGVTGRHALIRRACELGCFGKPATR